MCITPNPDLYYRCAGSECNNTIIDLFSEQTGLVSLFLPMDVVIVPQGVEVFEFGSVIKIPSQLQVCQAISKVQTIFSYIEFPF